MSEINDIIYKRGQCKAKLTRFQKFVSELKANPDDINEVQAKELSRRISDVKQLLIVYEKLNNEIVSKRDNKENVDKDEVELDKFEGQYYNGIAEAEVLVDVLYNQPESTSTTNVVNNTPSPPPLHKVQVALPELTLPKFSGNFDAWQEFDDAFHALVDTNPALTDVQKFYYLKSCLVGEATNVISNISVTEEHYKIAMDMLCERFRHKRLTANKLIARIVHAPPILKRTAKEYRCLVDTVQCSLRCLETLKIKTDDWSILLIYIISEKLDYNTRKEWEGSCSRDLPTLKQFIKFLERKCEVLESINEYRFETKSEITEKKVKPQLREQRTFAVVAQKCNYCLQDHLIQNCDKFLKLTVFNRFNAVKRKGLCFNCLENTHVVRSCLSAKCEKCKRAHHLLLHYNNLRKDEESNSKEEEIKEEDIKSHHNTLKSNKQVLLSTAIINVFNVNNEAMQCRVLIDNGSQPNFITQKLFQILGLKASKVNIQIAGVNNTKSESSQQTFVKIKSMYNDYNDNISCFIVPKITEYLPSSSVSINNLILPSNVILADPQFNVSQGIDMLLGAEIFYDILSGGQVHLGTGLPTLQNTKLGWILGGNLIIKSRSHDSVLNSNSCIIHENIDLNCEVRKFWEIESIQNNKVHHSKEEEQCELFFKRTIGQNTDGRFIVKVPWKDTIENLGNSRNVALRRFFNLERKFRKNDILKKQYVNFMGEYESLGHMQCIDETLQSSSYYIPHHAVINESSSTTKLRIVFDASCKTDNNISLNEVQMVGPTIQTDLFGLLVKFRKHKFVLTADIKKMYRQIQIHKDDRKYHRIFWRKDESENVKCYELNTVTYGTASAPFLAVRCLFELANQCEKTYPREASIIRNDFYVDDLLTGAESINEIKDIRANIVKILQGAGLELHKWASNNESVRSGDETEDVVRLGDVTQRMLGIGWKCDNDTLHYILASSQFTKHTSTCITKREILATTARIFDPLGLLGPIIVVAKLILQKLWQQKISWDDSVPNDIYNNWKEYECQLAKLNVISIPRRILCDAYNVAQIHGFSDSSEKAYGACLYLRSKNREGDWTIRLLCAKSKVAPLKTISLPRLELEGAVLLSKLLSKVMKSIEIHIKEYYLWCDSTIVLGWISSSPSRWKTYVGNRVAVIQELTVSTDWRHVSSQDNPADIISRGCTVSELQKSQLWWMGPHWLLTSTLPSYCPTFIDDLPEQRDISAVAQINKSEVTLELLKKYSSITKLIRVIAYCRRFTKLYLKKESFTGPLTIDELRGSLMNLIFKVQSTEFTEDLYEIKTQGRLKTNSSLLSLSPFIGYDGLLRVGGRLSYSEYSYDIQHQILLPKNHILTFMLMRREHEIGIHCGSNTLLANFRQMYWPIGGRYIAKEVVRKCIVCARYNLRKLNPKMGDLPKERSLSIAAFTNTGIDYAGPILLKDKRSRGCKLIKGYICLFVCFSTKAIHLELVTELSTECFLAALRRFVSRRGKPNVIYSDNATNFIGARNELVKFVCSEPAKTDIKEKLAIDSIDWKFIPPKSPHFGGLWEAGVKSVKGVLKKVMGNTNLIYEDMCTVLTQVESILNSRPLSPLSNDPNDMSPLTPGHFLIGRPLNAVPDRDVGDTPENRLSNFQRLQQIQQHFWKRWVREYLAELQKRHKWKSNTIPVQVGDMVLLREDHLPPQRWLLGRIIEVSPGPDNIIRVVRVRTTNGEYTRSVTKLSVLPFD